MSNTLRALRLLDVLFKYAFGVFGRKAVNEAVRPIPVCAVLL